jgi:hypothetical protein
MNFLRYCCFSQRETLDDFGSYSKNIFNFDTGDIQNIPSSATEGLQYFGFSGLKTKARVEEVVDGDTIIISFIVNLGQLSEKKECGRSHNQFKSQILSSSLNKDVNIIVKKRARLAEIDAAEHDTVQGQLATFYMKKLFEKNNGYINIEITKMDKFERPLIKIYCIENNNEYLNFHLIGKSFGKYGVIASKYKGEAKSEYFKNLDKIDLSLQNKCKIEGFEKVFSVPLEKEITTI